eukprot:TRINITY_DN2254_c0_g2_i1.p1 TRINITY_DN2254_c0_g2~~TRINITY_DN2254_c0_g2_i1.p1  ORF type:complete len:644 (+),score=212.80 TRINITY_DN2254_c0_g2_i1:100-1932(+)
MSGTIELIERDGVAAVGEEDPILGRSIFLRPDGSSFVVNGFSSTKARMVPPGVATSMIHVPPQVTHVMQPKSNVPFRLVALALPKDLGEGRLVRQLRVNLNDDEAAAVIMTMGGLPHFSVLRSCSDFVEIPFSADDIHRTDLVLEEFKGEAAAAAVHGRHKDASLHVLVRIVRIKEKKDEDQALTADERLVREVCGMHTSVALVRQALKQSHGNVEQAIGLLFDGEVKLPDPTPGGSGGGADDRPDVMWKGESHHAVRLSRGPRDGRDGVYLEEMHVGAHHPHGHRRGGMVGSRGGLGSGRVRGGVGSAPSLAHAPAPPPPPRMEKSKKKEAPSSGMVFHCFSVRPEIGFNGGGRRDVDFSSFAYAEEKESSVDRMGEMRMVSDLVVAESNRPVRDADDSEEEDGDEDGIQFIGEGDERRAVLPEGRKAEFVRFTLKQTEVDVESVDTDVLDPTGAFFAWKILPLKGDALVDDDIKAIGRVWEDTMHGLEESSWKEVVQVCQKIRGNFVDAPVRGENKAAEILGKIAELNMECPICCEKPVQCIMTHADGHGSVTAHSAFCRGCSMEYIQRQHTCPFCRGKVDELIDLEAASASSVDHLHDVRYYLMSDE